MADVHGSRLQRGKEYQQLLKELVREKFGFVTKKEGLLLKAKVLKVLSGKNALNQATTGGGLTTLVNSPTMPNAEIKEKDNTKQRVRVIARLIAQTPGESELDDDIMEPKKVDGSYEKDPIRLSAHGEYVAASRDSRFDDITVDSEIWIQLRTNTSSPIDGQAAGTIIGHKSAPDPLERIKEKTSPRIVFKPDCKANLRLAGPTAEFLPGSTDPEPNVQNPVIRKHKTLIKTGFYGNGTPQTKFHFDAALTHVEESVTSFHYDVPGPAPGKNSAFIWVGHLRNNGYLDLLDRPISLGRETIIYAPMTLNTNAPIELKYYFHDRGGFGSAWVNGPNTETDNAVVNAALPGNDFREKISPAIKDMIRDKRNFILVIPEMAFSRGFGTPAMSHKRVEKMARGQKVAPGDHHSTTTTMRTVVHPISRPAVKNYLKNLPASEIVSYGTGFLDLFAEQAAAENVLQKTHLRERETVTFDGSYTGGKFGDFHVEVLEVIGEHLGLPARENINYTSILADGLGAINLASIVKSMQFSSVHKLAETSFKSVAIDRIDFVEGGQDKKDVYNFSSTPAYAVWSDYILERIENPRPFEFNYITDHKPKQLGSQFFNKIGMAHQFNKAKSALASGQTNKDRRQFTEKINSTLSQTAVVSMHTLPRPIDGSTSAKVRYAFASPGDTSGTGAKPLLVPDNNLFLSPSIDSVPDHSDALTSRPSQGKIPLYTKIRENLKIEIDSFAELLNTAAITGDICAETAGAPYCTEGVFYHDRIKTDFTSFINNLESYYEYGYRIDEEKVIIKNINNREELQTILTDEVKPRYNERKNKNKDPALFLGWFPEDAPDGTSIFRWLMQGDEELATPGTGWNMNNAAEVLRHIGYLALPSLNTMDQFNLLFVDDPDSMGVYSIILSAVAEERALQDTKDKIENALEAMGPLETVPPIEGCDPAPLTLRAIQTTIPTPLVFNPSSMKIDGLCCSGKEIRVVSNYKDLKTMIPWNPKGGPAYKDMIGPASSSYRFTTNLSGLKESSTTNPKIFQATSFKYPSRGQNNSVAYRKSPLIWSCISDKILESWEAACNISGYVPFRIFSGIKGYDKKNSAVAYKNGISIDAFGLSMNVDSPIAGYGADGNPVYSVFTGMWTPGFVEQYSDELYDLGVLSYDPTLLGKLSDSGSRYKDNAYQGFLEREIREAQNWWWAEDSYNGPERRITTTQGLAKRKAALAHEPKPEYDKIMKAAKKSPIVPHGANPVLWLLTFCERSGMKWGNSFFLKKRFRGRKTGTTIVVVDLRSDTPASWTIAEQNRIAAIYDIPDIVARINAISWSSTSYDKHMHFQYYNGPPIIKWDDI